MGAPCSLLISATSLYYDGLTTLVVALVHVPTRHDMEIDVALLHTYWGLCRVRTVDTTQAAKTQELQASIEELSSIVCALWHFVFQKLG